MEPQLIDFSTALLRLKQGYRVARSGWNGNHMWLEIQRPDASSKMNLRYVYMSTAQGDLVPWVCSQTDMMVDDWYEVVR